MMMENAYLFIEIYALNHYHLLNHTFHIVLSTIQKEVRPKDKQFYLYSYQLHNICVVDMPGSSFAGVCL